MTEQALIVAEGLTKKFARTGAPAIDNLSACIRSGGVTGLVGPDGAGKTTLLRLFAGLFLPDSGRLSVCGFDPRTQFAKVRRSVGYMPQRFGLYEDLSVQQNLDLYADLRGVVGRERKDAYERLLAFTDLRRFTGRLAGKLSGGMKQKLGLACALIRTPALLLLDEPSVGVDPISRRELWQMVYELVDRGIGVVWSTAYLDEAERCSEVVLLTEGKALYDGPPSDLTARLEGRTFLVTGTGAGRRRLLARALRRPEVMDGVIQGSSVRLLLADGARPPVASDLGEDRAEVQPTPPRFEDAFVDLVGGRPRDEAPLAGVIRAGRRRRRRHGGSRRTRRSSSATSRPPTTSRSASAGVRSSGCWAPTARGNRPRSR